MTKLFSAKPFIIAEVGSNWTCFEDAISSIGLAKNAGADSVKFQLFSPNDLYGPGLKQWDAIKFTSDTEFSMDYQSPYLNPLWLPKLKEKADACGIEFMVTAFSPEGVAAVNPFVSVHKIASSCLTYPHLLEAVKKTGKPVILSTGASNSGDIKIALQGHPQLSWKGFPKDYPLVLMYCNAAYPSKRHNLFLMGELKNFGYPVGFSDHSLDVIYAPLSAVRHFSAVVIEKHFTAIEADTPDSGHSLNVDGFKCMVDYIRGTRVGHLNPTSEEKDMFLRHNVRLVATKDLKRGDTFKYGVNFGIFRALENDDQGAMGFCWDMLDGKPVTKDVAAGKGVSLGHVS